MKVKSESKEIFETGSGSIKIGNGSSDCITDHHELVVLSLIMFILVEGATDISTTCYRFVLFVKLKMG